LNTTKHIAESSFGGGVVVTHSFVVLGGTHLVHLYPPVSNNQGGRSVFVIGGTNVFFYEHLGANGHLRHQKLLGQTNANSQLFLQFSPTFCIGGTITPFAPLNLHPWC